VPTRGVMRLTAICWCAAFALVCKAWRCRNRTNLAITDRTFI
jgi:DNA-binding transcriptional regulator of glucitol operon